MFKLDKQDIEKDYQEIANILMNDIEARKDNRKLFIAYYKKVWGISVDEAFKRDDVPNYQTIERKARQLKSLNQSLRYDKGKEVDKYKEIGLQIPVVVKVI